MGHGSALAGVLVATVMAFVLDLGSPVASSTQKPLGRILEAMLPSAWRTASPGFAGEVEFGQKGWRDESKSAIASVMELVNDPEEDLPLNKYPPGMRTERRDLGDAFGDALVAAASEAVGLDCTDILTIAPNFVNGAKPASNAGAANDQPAKTRRWGKKS